MSGLRFCMITTFYPPYHFGGDAIGIQRLTYALARRGHHVTVIHDVDAFKALSDREPEQPELPENVEVVPLESGWGTLSPFVTQQTGRPLVTAARIKRLLDEGDFDVIVYHNVSLVGGPGVLAYGDALKIYMAHEHWLVCPSHVLWRHNRELCTGKQCLRCVAAYRRPPQLWRYTGLLHRKCRHVDAFIAMSEFSRGKHREFGFPFDMEVLPYFLPDDVGVPVEAEEGDGAQAPEPDGSPHDRPYFLFVGRLEPIKGLDDVIPLFRDYPDADLLIAGDGTYGDTLRAQAEGIDRVKFLGRLHPSELGRYYRNALALIVPSICFETFGIILIEAFTYGIPVVARRIGPFPEIVEASGGGLLFDGPDDLRDALARLQADDDLRTSLARSGSEARQRLWSESAVIPRYLDIVRRAAERRGRSRVLDKLMENRAS